MPTLSTQALTKKYSSVTAIDNISIEVNEGELFGLIGPDGSGKTTLMRILATLLLPDSGTATVLGMDVVKDFKKVRHETGYMPGRFSLYQDLSIEENLTFFATIFGTTLKENYDIIRDIYVQIEPFKDRRAGKLSGGMKQKLALCCALIHKPKVLILDEPTTGVDPVSRREFWDILGRLKKTGMTILVSTPYMDEASRCDRVALMQAGKILTIDTPTQITKNFNHKIFAIRAENMYRLLNELRTWKTLHSVNAFGEFAHYIDKSREVDENEIGKKLEEAGFRQIEIKETSPTIEDCFMGLMKLENFKY